MTMTAQENGHRQEPSGGGTSADSGWGARTDARLETARHWLDSGGSVLIHGPAEARLSAALDVVSGCRADRMLHCRLRPGDRDRPYAALGRLLESIAGADLELLSNARRGVLIAVLAGHVARLRPAAARITVLNLLRQLARQRCVLLVIDDVQDIDADSADVLAYVAARVDDLPVRMAATERVPDEGLPQHRRLCPSPLLVVRFPATA